MRMIRAVQIDAALLRARYPLAFFFLAAAMAPEIPWWRDAAWAVFLIGLLLPRAPQLAGESRAMSASVRRGIGCGLLAAAAIYSEWGRAFSLCIAAGLIFGELLLADSRAASAERLFAIVLATVVLCFGIVPQIAQAGDSVFYRQFSFLRRLGALGGDIAGEFVGAPLGEFGVGGFSRRRYFCIADGDFGAFHHRFVVARTAALSAGGRGGGFGIRRIRSGGGNDVAASRRTRTLGCFYAACAFARRADGRMGRPDSPDSPKPNPTPIPFLPAQCVNCPRCRRLPESDGLPPTAKKNPSATLNRRIGRKFTSLRFRRSSIRIVRWVRRRD